MFPRAGGLGFWLPGGTRKQLSTKPSMISCGPLLGGARLEIIRGGKDGRVRGLDHSPSTLWELISSGEGPRFDLDADSEGPVPIGGKLVGQRDDKV